MIEIVENDISVCKDKDSSFTFLFHRKVVWSVSDGKTSFTKLLKGWIRLN